MDEKDACKTATQTVVSRTNTNMIDPRLRLCVFKGSMCMKKTVLAVRNEFIF
jgi:hypothetical protein